MSSFGFSLVLAAALCHAAWNFLVKRINSGPELIWLFSVVSLIVYLPPTVYVVATTTPRLGTWEVTFILGSAMLHLGYFLLLQRGYRHGDLSLVYPTARATGPLVATGLAVMVLGESLPLQAALGAVIIVVAVAGLTGGIRSVHRLSLPSISFGLAAGLLIGSYTAWDAFTVATLLVPPLVLEYASGLGRALLLFPLTQQRRNLVRQCWRHHRTAVVAIAVLNPLAYILVLYALTFTPVIYVAPVRELSVLISVLLGTLVLGEGQLKQRFSMAMAMLVGVALLAGS